MLNLKIIPDETVLHSTVMAINASVNKIVFLHMLEEFIFPNKLFIIL